MKISMNSTAAFHGTTIRDIVVAKAAGYDAVELQTPKLFRFLDAGYTGHDLMPLLDGFPVSGVGAIQEAPDEEFKRDAIRLPKSRASWAPRSSRCAPDRSTCGWSRSSAPVPSATTTFASAVSSAWATRRHSPIPPAG
jgi:hypothetical protein